MGVNGSCLCGAVKYTVDGDLSDVTACHCNQCRKQTGHFYAASRVADADLVIEGGHNLTWYAASTDARRGFCKTCGSALFWKENVSGHTSILVGSLDSETDIRLVEHIFVGDKGSYYSIDDDLPKHNQSRSSQ